MNKAIKEQLEMLKNLEFQVDGKPSSDFPDSFSNITFYKSNRKIEDNSEKTFVFADYIVTPFEGFDFHKKFNKDVPPPEKVMVGVIVRETDKMYYLKVRNSTNSSYWEGWCPKKSCTIQ